MGSAVLATKDHGPHHRHDDECIDSIGAPNGTALDYYSLADERAFRGLTYKWTIAWDRKDLATWLSITAPQVVADYSDYPAVGTFITASPGQIFNGSFTVTGLGDERLGTQHLLGASLFTRTNSTQAKGDWQVRARHVRTLANGTEAQWDSSSSVEFLYQIVEGAWKIGGIRPHTVTATTGRPEDVIGQFP
ncbi:hypothetical protein MBLNU230_g4947t1 [Neophaeotheca triangularis]